MGPIKSYKKKNGQLCYQVRYKYRDEATGKRKDGFKAGFERKKDAEKYLTEVMHRINTNTFVSQSKITVKAYMENWLRDHVEKTLKQTTVNSHVSKVEWHIMPNIGEFQLQELRARHIRTFYENLLNNGRVSPTKKGVKGLSITTVRQVKAILSKALKDAVHDGYLVKNPAEGVSLPSAPESVAGAKDNYYTQDQFKELLCLIEDHPIGLPAILSATTSMRRCEVLGLAWKDIDFKEGKISIQRGLSINRQRELYFDSTKSTYSNRVVYPPTFVMKKLKKHRPKILSINPDDIQLVFTKADGNPYNPDTFSRMFTNLIEKHELPKLTYHGLRHTYATVILDDGTHNINDISKSMGHSKFSTTSDFYGHVTEDKKRKMADTMDRLFGEK